MKVFLGMIAALVVVGVLAVLALIFWPLERTTADQLALADDVMAWPDLAENERPRAAAIAADCVACHSTDDGAEYAGGRAFPTPMGTIYSSNITPDSETGIGNYTLDQFRAALVDGVDARGGQLYPAMPYTNYRSMSERDIKAIYSYFMNEVDPVRAPDKAAEMTFPFNLRFGVRAWKWLAMPDPGFNAPDDAILARGAYLVEGPEHCGDCHTPRNMLYIQDGYTASDERFMSGGDLQGWSVPSLRGDDGAPAKWSAAALTAYLATGRNAHSATGGEMTGVVGHSLQHLPASDLEAIVAYLRHLAPNGGGDDDAPEPADRTRASEIWLAASEGGTAEILASADPDALSEGGRLYLDNCSACHMIDGKGGDSVFPKLDGNSAVTAASPKGLVSTILNGARLPSTKGAPLRLAMPGFADRLSDVEVAELASFVRGAWSNRAGEVTAEDVGNLRN